ncbi:Chromatin assembly factor 1 subunit FSM [Frankliniella fusca]|uniref:Chromatin assembly factor 1 subunit FSM n=1 Tax=Frankliniella fusca TaxID=407009 RepID=A0AAE1GXP5_9NEOP|nr:Chromatin assembly factor 1 subunit FSM [Frankliniella fusca]
MKVFREKYGLRDPEEIFLGYGFDSRQHPKRPRLESRQVSKTYQYVSIKDLLKDVLSDKYLRDLITAEKKSTDGINFYVDDLEITQALSPAAGDYKIAGFYFGIQNLPPELNAMLNHIFVTGLAFSDDVANPKVWERFLEDMRHLETNGIDIDVDGVIISFKAVLVAQIGDSLAAAEILGFRKSSANKFCRWCYMDRKDMWRDGCMLGEPRTPERHEQDVEAASVSEANRTRTGVDGPSKLHGLTFFKPVGFSVFDYFHDLLQGINKMEVKMALRHYVCVKKHFSIQELRSRVQFFDYGYPDKKNKPRSNFTRAYLNKVDSYNLHQTGAQVWCLTRAFPFLFADLVPSDDPYMKLISLLNQMMTIIFSHAVLESDIRNLERLIEDHHKLFKEIFPGTPEPAVGTEESQNNAIIQQEEDEDDVENHGLQDFFVDSDDEIEDQVVNTAETYDFIMSDVALSSSSSSEDEQMTALYEKSGRDIELELENFEGQASGIGVTVPGTAEKLRRVHSTLAAEREEVRKKLKEATRKAAMEEKQRKKEEEDAKKIQKKEEEAAKKKKRQRGKRRRKMS